ncbi:NRDE family protein [Novispirillum itersonii]|uniref:NRDE family protein n=1 Tax=Novispirillum itersonii TaxID=189 RepID=UPI00036FE72B|nr:NRDE family protein [Novispirillum itersonii]
MCTVAILRRPGHRWPVLIGANRDEMRDRPALLPGRHWPDRPEVTAGQDLLAGGSWMGLNDHGVTAAILNRFGTLGPASDKRSRGELVLEALDHADAADAVAALAELDGRAYRPFNMIVADNTDAWWLRHADRPDGIIEAVPLPEGLSMITGFDLNDVAADPRLRRALPAFRAAAEPDPDAGDWAEWKALLASRDSGGPENDPRAALCFLRPNGFGTVSSSLLALPAVGAAVPAVWLYAAGPPDQAEWAAVPAIG